MKVFDAEGNELEVLSPEEVEALKKDAETAKSKAEILEQDKTLINWGKSREMEKRLREELAKTGKSIDENGQLVDTSISKEDEIKKEAYAEARRAMLDERLSEELAKYKPEERDVVKRYYEKLTTGEEVSLSNVRTFLSDAERLAIPNNSNPVLDRMSASRGDVPAFDGDKTSFAETDEGKSLASTLGIKLSA
jgi:hypothetical protein